MSAQSFVQLASDRCDFNLPRRGIGGVRRDGATAATAPCSGRTGFKTAIRRAPRGRALER